MQTLLVASLALLGLAPLPERADDTTHTRRVSISWSRYSARIELYSPIGLRRWTAPPTWLNSPL